MGAGAIVGVGAAAPVALVRRACFAPVADRVQDRAGVLAVGAVLLVPGAPAATDAAPLEVTLVCAAGSVYSVAEAVGIAAAAATGCLPLAIAVQGPVAAVLIAGAVQGRFRDRAAAPVGLRTAVVADDIASVEAGAIVGLDVPAPVALVRRARFAPAAIRV